MFIICWERRPMGNKMKEKQILNFAILVLITENSECESSDMNTCKFICRVRSGKTGAETIIHTGFAQQCR